MITTDKITVKTGDKVWHIDGHNIEEGVVTHFDNYSTCIRWLDTALHEECYPDAEIFGSERNAINVLIYRATKQMERLSELVDSLEDRLKELQ